MTGCTVVVLQPSDTFKAIFSFEFNKSQTPTHGDCTVVKMFIQKNRQGLKLDLMFMEHYAQNRCLHIKVAKLRTGLGSAGASNLQNCQTIKRALESRNLQREIIRKKRVQRSGIDTIK